MRFESSVMNNLEIVAANEEHFSFLEKNDKHISKKILQRKIEENEILILLLNCQCIGWLRYGLFWDEIPFLNMIYLLNGYRKKGYGKILLNYWENMMFETGIKKF